MGKKAADNDESSKNAAPGDEAERGAPTFEESLERVESIVSELESGKLTLDQSLERYEAGVRSMKECYRALRDAERRIELVAGIDAEGRATTQPFDDDATSLEEKRQTRSRRRSQSPDATASRQSPSGASRGKSPGDYADGESESNNDVDDDPTLF